MRRSGLILAGVLILVLSGCAFQGARLQGRIDLADPGDPACAALIGKPIPFVIVDQWSQDTVLTAGDSSASGDFEIQMPIARVSTVILRSPNGAKSPRIEPTQVRLNVWAATQVRLVASC